ncbi:putative disease resistance RPP13-like protein 3 [Gastrolobium bilobum]|uniref:putative disease resistance RPP13-like protein 3 n=1 Tax=Gastrolobium bilobum TaxID=150636 RepID=UPI002AAF1BBF|nr:putative disease resistance RPP13-like protein 3 [Gastrolobium bilobum]
MADLVVRLLLQNLPQLLEDEFKLLSGVEDKINSLTNELKFIDLFLKSSEGKRNDDCVKTIEKIKSYIVQIYTNKERYGIGEGEFKSEEEGEEQQVTESLRKRRKDVEEEHVVGLVQDSNVVITQLMETDSRLNVVPIIGMGGLGKTTLARKIYNNNKVKELFRCRAWGDVSNDYRPMELLLSLFKCFQSSSSEYNNLNEEELKMMVRECLKGKRYLIVLDDIWKTQVWDDIKGVFPDDKNRSRILITSRIKEVTSYCGTTPPYNLPLLNKEQSWELFSKKVFQGEECPSDLEHLGRSIAESCGGLPLGIVVLAGLVRKKERSEREWSRLKKISWHLTQDKTEVMDILKLSYDNLPRRLKPCFLYFAIYPEDYEIRANKLMELWIAEGFIQPKEIGYPNPPQVEDIAEYYLDELVDRSLVKVVRRRIDGGVKTCQIHDLLRDLCISESKSNGLLEVSTGANMDTLSSPHRLSLHGRAQSYLSFDKFNQSSTRSLFFFTTGKFPHSGHDHVMKNFKLARVLYAEASLFSSLSIGLKMMIHLRYLKVDTDVRDIPASICSLRNLEMLHLTLPLIRGRWSRLPMGMGRCRELSSLTNLRSIKLIGFEHLPLEFPSNIVKITLQSTVIDGNKDIMKTLGRLANLQILKLKYFVGLSDIIIAAGEFPRLRWVLLLG